MIKKSKLSNTEENHPRSRFKIKKVTEATNESQMYNNNSTKAKKDINTGKAQDCGIY